MEQTFGDKLKQARTCKGLKQSELAKQLGVTNTTISNWEKNVSKPDLDMLSYVCGVLNVKPNYFLSPALPDDEISIPEFKLIEKYRTLDPTGKSHVDTVLDWEAARSADILQKDARITDLETELANVTPDPAALLNAAHERTDIPVTEEMKQADDDIMNDENF